MPLFTASLGGTTWEFDRREAESVLYGQQAQVSLKGFMAFDLRKPKVSGIDPGDLPLRRGAAGGKTRRGHSPPEGKAPPQAKPARRQSPSAGKAPPQAKPLRRQSPPEGKAPPQAKPLRRQSPPEGKAPPQAKPARRQSPSAGKAVRRGQRTPRQTGAGRQGGAGLPRRGRCPVERCRRQRARRARDQLPTSSSLRTRNNNDTQVRKGRHSSAISRSSALVDAG
jgi:hypothetical protein